jgi:hypothetical protein
MKSINVNSNEVYVNSRPFLLLDPRPLNKRRNPFIERADYLSDISKGHSVKLAGVWLGDSEVVGESEIAFPDSYDIEEFWAKVLAAHDLHLEVELKIRRLSLARFYEGSTYNDSKNCSNWVFLVTKDIVMDIKFAGDATPVFSRKTRPHSLQLNSR